MRAPKTVRSRAVGAPGVRGPLREAGQAQDVERAVRALAAVARRAARQGQHPPDVVVQAQAGVAGLWEGKTRRDQMEHVGCGAMRGVRPGRGGPDVARRNEPPPPGLEPSRRLLGSEIVQTLYRRAVRGAGGRPTGPTLVCRAARHPCNRLCQMDKVLPPHNRAYGRVNDLHGLVMYYLIGNDTIDGDITSLINSKRLRAEAVTDGGIGKVGSIAGELIREADPAGAKARGGGVT